MRKYSLHYLTKDCANLLKKEFGLTHKKALDVLANGLLFNSFDKLTYAFGVGKKNHLFDSDNIKDHDNIPHDIAQCGFIFSEFRLKNALENLGISVSLEKVLELKSALDYCLDSWDGNIFHSSPERIHNGLQEVHFGKSARIMCDWPLVFYSRHEEDILVTHDQCRKHIVSGFWLDSFRIETESYFVHFREFITYLNNTIEQFMEYDNVIFLGNILESKAVKSVLNNFKSYEIQIPNSITEKGILIPTTSDKPLNSQYYPFII